MSGIGLADSNTTVVVEILAIGNELLTGDVQDTNTHWLCRQLIRRGGRVHRATLLPDEVSCIAAEIRAGLARRPDLLLTTGGLGPTNDDRTLEAVARACDRPLVEDPQAVGLVTERYAELARQGHVADAAVTEPRQKMARLPQGAQPLANPVGTAPAVALHIQSTWIVSLPGVPGELKGIFASSLQSLLTRLLGEGSFAEAVVITQCGDESVLAPIVQAVAEAHPQVYVKSHATHFGPDVRLRITLSASAGPGQAEGVLAAALQDLRQRLRAAEILSE